MPACVPAVERCIFRAPNAEAFTAVMEKPIGAFSLQEAVARSVTELSLHQHLPASPDYPAMVVVDLTPATRCRVDPEVPATFIVLPPENETDRPSQSVDEALDATADRVSEPRTEGAVTVVLDASRQSQGEAAASAAVLSEMLVESGSVLQVGDEEVTCAFVVVSEDSYAEAASSASAADGQCVLRVGPALFRNIRSAYAHRSLFAFPNEEKLGYGDTTFHMPLFCLRAAEDNQGEQINTSHAANSLRVEKLLLCPAVDDFVLTNILGDSYADTLAVALAAAARQLNGRFVSEGDVIDLSLTSAELSNGSASDVDGTDTAESMLASVHHKVSQWDGLWTSEDDGHPCTALSLFRVVEARGCAPLRRNFGFVVVDSGSSSPTEVSLVSQQRCAWTDPTPVRAPESAPQQSAKGAQPSIKEAVSFRALCTDFQSTLRAALSRSVVPDAHGVCGGTFVVHGVKENFPTVFIEEAARSVGLTTMFASAESLEDAEELRTLLTKLSSAVSGIALVVRNAQVLAAQHAELLPLLDLTNAATRAHGDEHSERGGARGCAGVRVVFLVCETVDAVSPSIAARATNAKGVLECGNPSEGDRRLVLSHCVRRAAARYNFCLSILLSFEALSAWTVGVAYADLVELARECALAAYSAAAGDHSGSGYPQGVRPVLSEQLCETVLQKYLKDHGHNLVSTKLTPVRWSDVGGLEDAKRELKETIQLPILHPEIFAGGMKKRTGILFYGPPGCGKTLLAKAVATEMNMNFMSVKGPELINQYVGESERNIRLLFQRARDNSPCIVFFDELDALAPARGAKGDAGGAMDRIVSQLLVEVDGVGQTRSDGSSSGDVFIIGATNRPDLLDPSLLRPGRFDRLCYLGIPSTREEQMFALKALTRKFSLDPDVNLSELLAPLDFVYTGADFFALCSDAMMFSVEEALEKARADIELAMQTQEGPNDSPLAEGAEGEDRAEDEAAGSDDDDDSAPIQVRMNHFIQARNQLKPSVTKDDLKKYEALKAKFNK